MSEGKSVKFLLQKLQLSRAKNPLCVETESLEMTWEFIDGQKKIFKMKITFVRASLTALRSLLSFEERKIIF